MLSYNHHRERNRYEIQSLSLSRYFRECVASLEDVILRQIIFIAMLLFMSSNHERRMPFFVLIQLPFSALFEVSLRDKESTRFAIYHSNPRGAKRTTIFNSTRVIT